MDGRIKLCNFQVTEKQQLRYDWKINRITIVVVKLFSGL